MLTVICAALALSAGPSRPHPDVVDVLYLSPSGPKLLRLHLRIDGQPYRQKFEAAIGGVFDTLDKDRDGVLSVREAAAAPDLAGASPLARLGVRGGAGPARPTGPLTRAGLEAYYAKAGVMGFQIRGVPAVTFGDDQRTAPKVTARLFKLLDADGDGLLSKAELAAAERVLSKYDADEDELVNVDEVMDTPSGPALVRARAITMAAVADDFIVLTDDAARAEAQRRGAEKGRKGGIPAAPDAEILVARNSGTGEVAVTAVRLGPAARLEQGGGVSVLALSNVELRLSRPPSVDRLGASEERQYQALFMRADTDGNGHLDHKEAERIPFFVANFDAMDADGDRKITLKEVLAFVKKLNALRGAVKAASLSLSVDEQGQGLFDLLDLDRDGVLGVRELRRAPEVLTRLGVKALAAGDVPRQLRGAVDGGGADNAFALRAARLGGGTPARPAPRKGPEWFRRMDRNGDGDISRAEWLGPREEFDRIDADKDGLISAEEAEAYEKAMKKK